MAIYSKFLSLITGIERTVDLSSNTLSLGALQLNGSTSGTLTQNANATTTSYSIFWPAAQGGGSTFLQNDGAGNLSWAAAPATGANTALSNLSAVAINTSLLPGADNSINLGSASFSWAAANIHSLLDGSSAISVDAYGRALLDSAAATQLAWSTSGVAFSQLTASTVPYLNASKVLTSSAVTPTQLSYLDATSSIQTQLNGKLSSGLTSAHIFVGNVSNVATDVAVSGDLTLANTGAFTIAAGAVTASKLGTVTDGVTLDQSGAGSTLEVKSGGISNTQINASAAIAYSKLAALGGSTNDILIQNGSGFVAPSSILSTNLFLADGSVTGTGAFNLGGFTPTNSGTPVNPNDLVNKSYVDNFINATSWKTAVLVATTANITLSGEQTIDGFLTSSSRVLVKNQSTASQNGIYVSASGAWSRSSDMAAWSQVPAAAVFVEEGTVNADLGWVCTSQPGGTIGTTAITFVQFSSAGAYSADGITLQLISGVFSVKSAGITETQIASSAFSSTGAIVGGSGTKISVQVDNSTIDINGSNQLEVKAAGITSTQLASASVTTAKLGTITDGVTLDQSGSGSTLEIKNAGVSATQLATGAFDQVTITGGAGTPASVAQAPSLKRTLVAGQSFTANTSYAVRWGLTANGESSNRVYAADITTSSFDLFYVIGMASSGTSVSAGQNIAVTTLGSFALSSADSAFASSTDGAPVFLTASGTFSVTAPSTAGQAITRIGIVQARSATVTSNIIDVLPVPVGVN